MENQEAPFCVQIEPTEGCPLRCSFCGINGIRDDQHVYKHMTLKTAKVIAEQVADLDWNPRIEFAMHGEPTLNPHLIKIIQLFRYHLPKAYLLLETNGYGLLKKDLSSILRLFTAGLNTIAVDEYQQLSWAQKLRKKWGTSHLITKEGIKNGLIINHLEYPMDGPIANPHKRQQNQRLIFVAPIDLATKGTHSTLSNHAGNGAPLNNSKQNKRCAKPFREMSFRYDGNVAICCNDWRGIYVIGNVHKLGVEVLWHHPRFIAARKYLYNGLRMFPPCQGCDAVSYRTGLLPDKKGKEQLPLPDFNTTNIVMEAINNGPLTIPVLRPWEKKNG